MLPIALLSVERIGGGAFAPRYLSSRDEVWIQYVLGEYSDLIGLSQTAVESAWDERIAPAVHGMGSRPRAAVGVRRLLERRYSRETRAAANPVRIRECVFRHAVSGGTRADILGRAAAELGIEATAVTDGLFADRAQNRCLVAPAVTPSPRTMVEDYNLALVQGLMLRTERVQLQLSHSVRAVVRYAKLRGLLASFTPGPRDSVCADISGPLSLFRNTTKYGHALATFVPVLGGTPSFCLDAVCRFGDTRARVLVRSEDPIARTHRLPREFDSGVERALMRDVRRLGSAWTLTRETVVLRAGSKLVFPDFTLTRGEDRVLVEVVGFYTEQYLARKFEGLRAANVKNLIVCVDSALDCGDRALEGNVVLPFRRRVNAADLLAAASRLVQGEGRPSVSAGAAG